MVLTVVKSHAMKFPLKFPQLNGLLCAIAAAGLLAIISSCTYDKLPKLISVSDETALHYQQLAKAASTGRPWWPSLDAGANLNRLKSGLKEDQQRRAMEMRARLDEEVPIQFTHSKVP